MPYPEMMVAPMREDLNRLGAVELKTAEDVDNFMAENQGTALLVFNSVCGCAAGNARPAVGMAMEADHAPAKVVTVFAGQDVEAAARAREKFPQLPPSSPSMVIINGSELVEYIPRHQIEGRDAQIIAADITAVFERLATA